ncbi:hypothetical protein BGX28_004132 [Mortierella sp. GBA30]|nr:hypothetical protein BGX28_004132 [Mortierella sp. GBA30]
MAVWNEKQRVALLKIYPTLEGRLLSKAKRTVKEMATNMPPDCAFVRFKTIPDHELDLFWPLPDSLSNLKVADKPDNDPDTESDEEFSKKSRGSTEPTAEHSAADIMDNCSAVAAGSKSSVHVSMWCRRKVQTHHRGTHDHLLSIAIRSDVENKRQFDSLAKQASTAGFELALRQHCKVPIETRIVLDGVYRFCAVHYNRSVHRVMKDSSLVPAPKKDVFRELAFSHLTIEDLESALGVVESIVTHFPDLQAWMNWYINIKRAPSIFPAFSVCDFSRIRPDTNAQESIGAEFKRLVDKGTIIQAMHDYIRIFKK